jgi:hypothetical protein
MRTRVAVGGRSEPATTIRRHDLEVPGRQQGPGASIPRHDIVEENARFLAAGFVLLPASGFLTLLGPSSLHGAARTAHGALFAMFFVLIIVHTAAHLRVECVSRGTRSTDSIRA